MEDEAETSSGPRADVVGGASSAAKKVRTGGKLAAQLGGPYGVAIYLAVVAGIVVAAIVGVFVVVLAVVATAQARYQQATELTILDVPGHVVGHYHRAAQSCDGLDWALLAGIGFHESGHGTSGGAIVGPTGDVTPPIVGIALNGNNGTAAVPAPDGGSPWHTDPVWDHATGPMQFITTSWAGHGKDGNDDGVASPHNFADAAAAAAGLLCGTDGTLEDEAAALFSYNHSSVYVALVLAKADEYRAATPVGGPVAMSAGGWICPVPGSSFGDTWGDPRSGGRSHKGVDMSAPTGRPIYASVSGTLENFHDGLGGLSFVLWGDDGNGYFGTHLSSYGTPGPVAAGTVIGAVGETGNAVGPHLHFEIWPGRTSWAEPRNAINPYPTVNAACTSSTAR